MKCVPAGINLNKNVFTSFVISIIKHCIDCVAIVTFQKFKHHYCTVFVEYQTYSGVKLNICNK